MRNVTKEHNIASHIHEEAVVFLGCVYMPFKLTAAGMEFTNFGQEIEGAQADVSKLRRGGVDALFLSTGAELIFVADPKLGLLTQPARRLTRPVFKGPALIKRVLWGIDAMRRAVEAAGDQVELAQNAADVARINGLGKTAVLMHLTGGHIDNDLAVLRTYAQLGMRSIQIAVGDTVDWADSCEGKARCGGLSSFGRQVIREMNRLGMVIDLAHASDKTVRDVLEVTEQPVIISHANCRTLALAARNVPDDLLEALARNGGVIGVHFFPGFLDGEHFKARIASGEYDDYLPAVAAALAVKHKDPFELAAALRDQDAWEAARRAAGIPPFEPPANLPRVALERVVDHIDHAVRVAGIDHVGIGTDFGGIQAVPEGLEDASRLPALTAALLERGYNEEQVRKLLGGNFLRVLKAVAG
jgi:membrane dipeptidase